MIRTIGLWEAVAEMRLDHVTVVLEDLTALDDVWEKLGLRRVKALPLFPGTERHVVPLHQGFVELVSLSDRAQAQNSTWGQALIRFAKSGEGVFRAVAAVPDLDRFVASRQRMGAQFWPPIEETIYCAQEALHVKMTQLDMMLPWIVEYQDRAPVREEIPSHFHDMVMQSPDPMITSMQYGIAVGGSRGADGHSLINDALSIRFESGDYTGFVGFTLASRGQFAYVHTMNHHIEVLWR